MYPERADGAPGMTRVDHQWPLSPKMLLSLLPETQQQVIRARARRLRSQLFDRLYGYDATQLTATLRGLGIGEGDAIMMQSSFDNLNGFSGEAADVIDCVLKVIGPTGHLFMVSMPYGGAARDYLRQAKPFDVRRTPSHMGFLSELFRRRKGVLRSANPMHPVLAWGPRAERIIEGHEDLAYSCGENSPFEKMLELDTKAFLFDVDLDVLTFAHYLEHLFRDTAPAPVYSDEPLEIEIIDRSGARRRVAVYPFAPEAMKLRNFGALYDELLAQNRVHEARIGNTDLRLVKLREVLACCAELVEHGGHIFAQPGEATHIKPRRTGRIRRLFRRR
jgi:aminoglycoside 3-N-acetyltransferase